MKLCKTLLFLFLSLQMFSQTSTSEALNSFLGTGFFNEFNTLKKKAERMVLDVKAIEANYSEEEISKVINAYNLTADRFNRALFNIKRDMLDKQMRKYIARQPIGYGKQIETDFHRAKNYCENTFCKEVHSLLGAEYNSTAILAMVPELIGYIELAVKVFKSVKQKFKQINEELLQKYMVEPYSFKTWDEI